MLIKNTTEAMKEMISLVYHPNTGHLAGIGKLLALAGWYVWLVLLCKLLFAILWF
jgi:hypothetical protein